MAQRDEPSKLSSWDVGTPGNDDATLDQSYQNALDISIENGDALDRSTAIAMQVSYVPQHLPQLFPRTTKRSVQNARPDESAGRFRTPGGNHLSPGASPSSLGRFDSGSGFGRDSRAGSATGIEMNWNASSTGSVISVGGSQSMMSFANASSRISTLTQTYVGTDQRGQNVQFAQTTRFLKWGFFLTNVGYWVLAVALMWRTLIQRQMEWRRFDVEHVCQSGQWQWLLAVFAALGSSLFHGIQCELSSCCSLRVNHWEQEQCVPCDGLGFTCEAPGCFSTAIYPKDSQSNNKPCTNCAGHGKVYPRFENWMMYLNFADRGFAVLLAVGVGGCALWINRWAGLVTCLCYFIFPVLLNAKSMAYRNEGRTKAHIYTHGAWHLTSAIAIGTMIFGNSLIPGASEVNDTFDQYLR